MTAIADVISEAMVVIDDVRLSELLAIDPAQFYRKMIAYVETALPLLSSPPELYSYITKGYTEPEYADTTWTSTEASLSSETAIETGYTGFELCSVVSVVDRIAEAYEASYDPETGIVTFPVQTEVGVNYEIDFYTDGSFDDLSFYKKRLLARAIALVWDERFERTWLDFTPKLQDSSFNTVNEANYMRAGTERLRERRQAFEDELHKYEQINAYNNVNRPYPQRTLL